MPALGALALIAAGAVVVFGAPPAAAFTKARINLTPSHPVFDGDYPEIPASFYEGTNAVTPTPTGCGNPDGPSDAQNPPPFGTQCDTIPLRVTGPTNLGPGDDYVVSVVLTWKDAPGKAAGQEGTVTDLDLHFFDDGQIGKRTDPSSTSDTELTSSAGGTIPESIKICCPDLGDYNIVVVNAGAGPNTGGYHLHVEMKTLKADKIFELLAQSPTTTQQPGTADTLPADLSGTSLVEPGLGDLTVVPGFEGNFSSLANAPLQDALKAPAVGDQAVAISTPGPVSGLTLLLWLSVLPLGVIGTLVGFALRRRNATRGLL